MRFVLTFVIFVFDEFLSKNGLSSVILKYWHIHFWCAYWCRFVRMPHCFQCARAHTHIMECNEGGKVGKTNKPNQIDSKRVLKWKSSIERYTQQIHRLDWFNRNLWQFLWRLSICMGVRARAAAKAETRKHCPLDSAIEITTSHFDFLPNSSSRRRWYRMSTACVL